MTPRCQSSAQLQLLDTVEASVGSPGSWSPVNCSFSGWRPGKVTFSYGKSPSLIGKSTISMGLLKNSHVTNYPRVISGQFFVGLLLGNWFSTCFSTCCFNCEHSGSFNSNGRFHIPAPAQRYVSPSKKMFCPRFSILYGWDCIGIYIYIYMMKLKATLLAHCLLASSKLKATLLAQCHVAGSVPRSWLSAT